MPATQTAFRTVLDELSDALVQDTRNDGTTFYKLKSDAPAWLQGSDVMLAIHKALDGRMPDDWVYSITASIAETLTGYDPDDAAAAREQLHEIVDGLVDVYNSDRTTWLAAHLLNADLVDEAAKELGSSNSDTFDRIGIGQYLAIDRIGIALIEQVENEADSREP